MDGYKPGLWWCFLSRGPVKEGIPQDWGVARILTHHLVIRHKPRAEKLPQGKGLCLSGSGVQLRFSFSCLRHMAYSKLTFEMAATQTLTGQLCALDRTLNHVHADCIWTLLGEATSLWFDWVSRIWCSHLCPVLISHLLGNFFGVLLPRSCLRDEVAPFPAFNCRGGWLPLSEFLDHDTDCCSPAASYPVSTWLSLVRRHDRLLSQCPLTPLHGIDYLSGSLNTSDGVQKQLLCSAHVRSSSETPAFLGFQVSCWPCNLGFLTGSGITEFDDISGSSSLTVKAPNVQEHAHNKPTE